MPHATDASTRPLPPPISLSRPFVKRAVKVARGTLRDVETGERLRVTDTVLAPLTVRRVPVGKVKVATEVDGRALWAVKRYCLRDRGLAATLHQPHRHVAARLIEALVREADMASRAGSPTGIRAVWVTATHAYGQMPLLHGDMDAPATRIAWRARADDAPCPALRALRAVLVDLARCHGRGIAHCDVKPGNIMHRGTPESAALVDYGLARPLGDTDAAVGTPYFMAPEQARAKVTRRPIADWARADVWGVGCAFLALLATNPFACEATERLARHAAYARWHATATGPRWTRRGAGWLPGAPAFEAAFGRLGPAWRPFFLDVLHPRAAARPDATAALRHLDALVAAGHQDVLDGRALTRPTPLP
jgi:hypothetical protein